MTPRSKEYLEFVRALPCAVCGKIGPSDPHHVESGGVGMKGSDGSVIPLCRKHHRRLEDIGHARAEKEFGFSVAGAIADTLHRRLFERPLRWPVDLIRKMMDGHDE